MANFLFGYNFRAYTASASSADTDFPATNLYDYEHALRNWRSTVTTASWVKGAIGSTITLKGVVLNDVNFTSVKVQYATSDSWSTPSTFDAISMDTRVGRYKIYVPFSSVSASYVRAYIPAQSTTDGESYFRIGQMIILDSVFEFTDNPTFPYSYSADEKMITNEFEGGGYEDVNLGPMLWEGSFGWAVQTKGLESEVNLFARMQKNANLVFYENYTDNSLFYICRRRTPVVVSWDSPYHNSIQTLTFKELY